jgi:hypothetical protein
LISDKKIPNKEPLKFELVEIKKELSKYDFQFFTDISAMHDAIKTGFLKMKIGNKDYEFKVKIKKLDNE